MADFIYNDFPSESDKEQETKSSLASNTNPAKTNNIFFIIVSAFFATLIIITVVMGIIIANKLDGSSDDKKKVDSLIFSTPTTDTNQNPTTVTNESTNEFGSVSELVYSVKDSVVEIKVISLVDSRYVSESKGSGVIIGSYKLDGEAAGYYIVTNAHVIQDEYGNTAEIISVVTTDGKGYEATVRGTDEESDLAVLMIDTTDTLKGASFEGSGSLALGQEVVAIGTPLGELGSCVSNGVISGLAREIEIDGQIYKLLQTNAIISSGNSGGGLFNMKGKLIGIINTKASRLGIKELGFAIPSSDAEAIVNEIIEYGYVQSRPHLGITVSTITDNYGSYVYVHSIESGLNDNTLQVQDIILSLNGDEILTLDDYRHAVSKTKPSDTIDAYIKRGNEHLHVTLTVYKKIH